MDYLGSEQEELAVLFHAIHQRLESKLFVHGADLGGAFTCFVTSSIYECLELHGNTLWRAHGAATAALYVEGLSYTIPIEAAACTTEEAAVSSVPGEFICC